MPGQFRAMVARFGFMPRLVARILCKSVLEECSLPSLVGTP